MKASEKLKQSPHKTPSSVMNEVIKLEDKVELLESIIENVRNEVNIQSMQCNRKKVRKCALLIG